MSRLFLSTYLGIAAAILVATALIVLLIGWVLITGIEERLDDVLGPSSALLEARIREANDPAIETERASADIQIPLLVVDDLPELAERHQQRLREGKLTMIIEPWKSGPRAYLPLRGPLDGRYLQLGPVESHIGGLSGPAVVSLFIVLLALALAIFARIRPIQRQLTRLVDAADHFGQGKLETRVALPPGSALEPLASTFNNMGARIAVLVDGQQELLHAVSHELRTPLARLRFALAMLDDAGEPSERASRRQDMEADLAELDELVDELLTYARLQEGGPPLDRSDVDVSALIQGLRPGELKSRGIAYEVVVPAESQESIIADPRLLQRAAINLVNNAVRYASAKVRVSVAQAQDWVEVCVEDDGPGIPEDQRQRIFEPFARLDSSRTSSTGGTGLGLAIVRRIAHWHGGAIEVESSTLGGAKFTLRIRREEGATR